MQQRLQCGGRHGLGEGPALGGVAAEPAQPLQLRGGLDTLGDHVEGEHVGEPDDRFDDLGTRLVQAATKDRSIFRQPTGNRWR